MTYQTTGFPNDIGTLAKLPGWVTSGTGEAARNVAFLSGASFAMLDVVLKQSTYGVPKALLAHTLALKAAVATSKIEGRMVQDADIRDAFHLTPPDAQGVRHCGPDGAVLEFWRNFARLNLTGANWKGDVANAVDTAFRDDTKRWLTDAMPRIKSQGVLAVATDQMRAVLDADDRAEQIACLLSDVILAKAFGWDHPLPLTSLHLTKPNLRDLKDGTQNAETVIQKAITQSAQTAFALATGLAERATALKSVAPKLRAKTSDAALRVFLTEDAVAPSTMLSPLIQGTAMPMTSRAARRLCDRLVELGVVTELTGRATFRLYGLHP